MGRLRACCCARRWPRTRLRASTSPWRDAAYYLVLSLLMIPGVLTLIGRYLLIVQFGLMNSLWGLILPYIAGGLPLRLSADRLLL